MDNEKIIDKAAKDLKIIEEATEKLRGVDFIDLIAGPGQPMRFKTPEEAWTKFIEYISWCIANPMERVDVCKSGDNTGQQIAANVPRPFTMEGVYNYLNINADTFINYEGRGQNAETYKEFIETFKRIRFTVRQQKLEGAMIGNYHANLVARELGIGEKHEIEGQIEQKNVIEFGGKSVEI